MNVVSYLLILLTITTQETMILFDFNTKSTLSDWVIINDAVMGGRSNGSIEKTAEGHGVFKGDVSLDNNGGFSLLRYRFITKNVADYNKAIIKIKGDGKTYQFRMKSTIDDRHSYISTFQTTGEWQKIEFNFADMYPVFRGNRLNIANYPGETVEEIAFLIGNKKAEQFQLLIDSITLE